MHLGSWSSGAPLFLVFLLYLEFRNLQCGALASVILTVNIAIIRDIKEGFGMKRN